jgi:hypothetical protein
VRAIASLPHRLGEFRSGIGAEFQPEMFIARFRQEHDAITPTLPAHAAAPEKCVGLHRSVFRDEAIPLRTLASGLPDHQRSPISRSNDCTSFGDIRCSCLLMRLIVLAFAALIADAIKSIRASRSFFFFLAFTESPRISMR